MKKVSVIVPVYNVEKYIDKCLNSLVNQTLEDIEIIVVNDGSPDNSQNIIDIYVKKYPDKVKSFVKENGGLGSARNYGFKYATGEYISYVDSDDYVSFDMFEKMYNIAKTKGLEIVVCNLKNVYENTCKNTTDKIFLKFENNKINAFFNDICACGKLFKKEILCDIKFKSKVWYEDLAFTCKVIMKSSKIEYINEGLYNYLIRNGSIMNNNNIKKNLDILDAFDDILNYIKINKEYEIYYPEIEYLAIYHIYIAAIVRVINSNANTKLKKEIIKKFLNYMNLKFPNYNKNKYIKFLDKNKKIIYNIIRFKQYWIVKLIFKIKK